MSIKSRFVLRHLPKIRDTPLATATKVSHSVVIPEATYSPWRDDEAFTRVFESICRNTLVDRYRAYELWSLAREVSQPGADLLEVGVWRGGTGCLLAARATEIAPSQTVFLCDTFRGVVKAGSYDSHYRGGEHADTSMDTVRQLATSMGLSNVELLEGIFPDETGNRIADRRFSLCHIDVDVYESARQVAEWVWPRLLPGGVLVYDDYGFATCEGVTELVNERRQRAEAVTVHNLNGHAVVVKVR